MKSRLAAALVLSLAAAGAARAQEAIPTAADATDGGAPQVATGGAPTMISNRHRRDDRGPVRIGPCGAPYRSVDGGPPKPDKSPHGEVFAGAGTHGYREAGGAVCIPIGENAAVTLAVDAGRWGRR
ncbi:MAG TPA: hypothetical protein VG166_06865 [Caulobacteraceae bacterium]|nr:hypothetical protein [Caulobacteraceae bacterium]